MMQNSPKQPSPGPSPTFAGLGLIPQLVRAVAETGYVEPTPIQTQSIPILLKGQDLLGCAQTGTGKTAAFALPILQQLFAQRPPEPQAPVAAPGARRTQAARPIRALILSPTRELASQIQESFATYGAHTGLRSMVIFGGVKQNPQVAKLQSGIDILVATPGRLLDLMGQGLLTLKHLTHFVLDEADRMLDMGFINDVRKVLRELPAVRHSLLFSATMPPDIESLAMTFLRNPARVAVAPVASTVETVQQSMYRVGKVDKPHLLAHLLADPAFSRVLVFTRTKHGANKVVKQLATVRIAAEAIHGNKSQNAREAALAHFKGGETRVLVATDIAARGLDVEAVSHVINYDLPNEPESYVHRIGRTARAGASGIAIAFCDWDERGFMNSIEKLINLRVPVVSGHPFESRGNSPSPASAASASPPSGRSAPGRPPVGRGEHRPAQQDRGGHGDRGRGGASRSGAAPSHKPQRPQRGGGPPAPSADEARRRRLEWAERRLNGRG